MRLLSQAFLAAVIQTIQQTKQEQGPETLTKRRHKVLSMAATSSSKPAIRESLAQLMLLAMRESGAEGCTLYGRNSESAVLTLLHTMGTAPSDAGPSEPGLITFPLSAEDGSAGLVTFRFGPRALSKTARTILQRMAGTFEAVWRLSYEPGVCAGLARQIGHLEAQLAEVKIADRARGLIEHLGSSHDAVDTMTHHVDSVLQSRRFRVILKELMRELEDQVKEREVTAQAKAVLQSTYGMSEEQAYGHLRITSRKTRKPMREIAQELIAGAGR